MSMPVHRLSRMCEILHASRRASDVESELAAAGDPT